MNKYERVLSALERGEDASMKVFGNSMLPIIESGSELTFRRTDDYQVGDVVISRVKGRVIDAHKITKIDAQGRFMISNNKGWDNGWASRVFGRVILVNGRSFGRATIKGDGAKAANS
jgi:SOS-response transcriptional repressor LexA